MKNEVETSLRQLIGLPLWGAGRAADLQWFQFGERRDVATRNGGTKSVGTWALHILCAWRIRSADRIVVTSSDCYMRADHLSESTEDFNWDEQGANQRDQRMAIFMADKEDTLIVTDVTADNFGGFCLQLATGFHLEVFPDVSAEDFEFWRLFQPSTESSHFVATSSGLEDQ
jgi:hypothetical protein